MRFRNGLLRVSALAIVAFATFAAGCGGGSNNYAPASGGGGSSATPVPAPVIPAAAAFSASSTQFVAAATPGPGGTVAPLAIALPAGGGITSTLGLPLAQASIPPNTALAITSSNTTPANVPVLLSAGRHAQDAVQGSVATIEIEELTFSNQVVFSAAPSFTFTVPATFILPNTSYYIAEYTPYYPTLAWVRGFEGPATISGTTATFTGTVEPYLFLANIPQYFAFYAVSAAAATPSPPPSAAPAPTPAPITASPSSVNLLGVGVSQAVTLTDAATTYTGGYTATSSDSTIATAAVSGTTVTVTSVAVGSTVVTVKTTDGRQVLIPVGVTATTVPVQ